MTEKIPLICSCSTVMITPHPTCMYLKLRTIYKLFTVHVRGCAYGNEKNVRNLAIIIVQKNNLKSPM